VPFPKIPASKNLSSASRLKRISRFTLDTLSPLHYQVSIGGPLVRRPHWTLSEFSLSRCRIWRPARASCSYPPAPDVLRNFLKQCKGSKGKREQKKKKKRERNMHTRDGIPRYSRENSGHVQHFRFRSTDVSRERTFTHANF